MWRGVCAPECGFADKPHFIRAVSKKLKNAGFEQCRAAAFSLDRKRQSMAATPVACINGCHREEFTTLADN
jgi:hypothetical protein